MPAEMISDPPMMNSINMELDEEEESFHNAADSFSTGEPDDDDNPSPAEPNPSGVHHADPSMGLEESQRDLQEFQQLGNFPVDGGERDDVKQLEERPAAAETKVDKSSSETVSRKVDVVAVDGKEIVRNIKQHLSDDPSSLTGSVNVKKARRSSRRSNAKKASPIPTQQCNTITDVCKRRVYSREEMVSMRFFGVVQQKRLWREIYNGLGTAAAEYANLVDHARSPKHATRNYNTNNAPTVGILGEYVARSYILYISHAWITLYISGLYTV